MRVVDEIGPREGYFALGPHEEGFTVLVDLDRLFGRVVNVDRELVVGGYVHLGELV